MKFNGFNILGYMSAGYSLKRKLSEMIFSYQIKFQEAVFFREKS